MDEEIKIQHVNELIQHQGWKFIVEEIKSDITRIETQLLEDDEEDASLRKALKLKRLDLKYLIEMPERLVAKWTLAITPARNFDPYTTAEDIRKERESG